MPFFPHPSALDKNPSPFLGVGAFGGVEGPEGGPFFPFRPLFQSYTPLPKFHEPLSPFKTGLSTIEAIDPATKVPIAALAKEPSPEKASFHMPPTMPRPPFIPSTIPVKSASPMTVPISIAQGSPVLCHHDSNFGLAVSFHHDFTSSRINPTLPLKSSSLNAGLLKYFSSFPKAVFACSTPHAIPSLMKLPNVSNPLPSTIFVRLSISGFAASNPDLPNSENFRAVVSKSFCQRTYPD